jgi:hypothetical protein
MPATRKNAPTCDRPWERGYLVALARFGRKIQAAKAVGIDDSVVRKYARSCPEFARAEAKAFEEYYEIRLEGTADQRAIDGWDEPVYQGGELVGTRRRYSDRLLELRLKAERPDKYRERVTTTHELGEPEIALTQSILMAIATQRQEGAQHTAAGNGGGNGGNGGNGGATEGEDTDSEAGG